MRNHSFTWNGQSSDEFGIKIERFPALNRPARKYTACDVPGRNGMLYDMQDAWSEVMIAYEIFAGGSKKNTVEEFGRILEWLNSASGYAELSDDYDINHYREAVFVEASEISNSWNRYGRMIATFRARPERFLSEKRQITLPTTSTLGTMNGGAATPMAINMYASASISAEEIGQIFIGELFEILQPSGSWYKVRNNSDVVGWIQNTYITTMTGSVVNNPTNHTAKPIMTFERTGSGQSVRVNDVVISFESGGLGDCVIDCENEDIYSSSGASLNQFITIATPSGNATADFMKLTPGKNYVAYSSAITMATRFWEI